MDIQLLASGILYRFSRLFKNISSEYSLYLNRQSVAREFIHGKGIEIGALHRALVVPEDAHVTYVDRLTETSIKEEYVNLRSEKLVKVDVIDDGEKLGNFQDNSQDFVIANHFLEHCENPIGAIGNMLRVLRPGGILYTAIPDMRYTWDAQRPLTALDHLIRDYKEGPELSRRSHLEEVARLVHKVQGEDEVAKKVDSFMEKGYDTHFHVWTQTQILELITYLKTSLNFAMDIELALKNDFEFIIVFRKTA